MAYQKLLQDTVISELEGKIVILQQEKQSIRENLTAELNLERQKFSLQTENIESFKNQIVSYESQLEYTEKKERKARRERNVAVVLGVLLLGLAAVK